MGWENSAALAEETDNPRRNVPRAVFASIILMAASYVLFSYVTVEGFGQNVESLGKTEIPFISVADDTLHAFAFFAYLAGLTSTLGVLIAGVNAQARMVFNADRKGLLPAAIGRVQTTRRTPVVVRCVFLGFSLLLVFAWGGRTDPLEFFAVLDARHAPRPRRLPRGQPRAAGLLPALPAGGVLRAPARGVAAARGGAHRVPALRTGQARSARAVQPLPADLCGHHRCGRAVRRGAGEASAGSGRPRRLDRRRQRLNLLDDPRVPAQWRRTPAAGTRADLLTPVAPPDCSRRGLGRQRTAGAS